MPRGLSLHIGVNEIDPQHYGSDGALRGCENDAHDMEAIAKAAGFRTNVLLTRSAKSATVLEEVRTAARTLRSGDTFLLTYSGHGSQVPNLNSETDDESDGLDETWVLFDRMVLDDELYRAWSEFAAGVRVLVISDSCHSATVARAALYAELASSPDLRDFYQDARPKCLDFALRQHAFEQHGDVYRRIEAEPQGSRNPIRASVMLLSACQDNQLAMDGARNGAFTAALKKVWDGGKFSGDHRGLWRSIARRLPPTQAPNLMHVAAPDLEFERSRPFALEAQSRVDDPRPVGTGAAFANVNGDAIAALVSSCLLGAEVRRRAARADPDDGGSDAAREVSVGVSVSVRL